MNIRNILNSYSETNKFEIKYIDDKIYIFYYDRINIFTSNIIELFSDSKKIVVKGSNLVIESMYKEYLIIKGNIKLLEFINNE